MTIYRDAVGRLGLAAAAMSLSLLLIAFVVFGNESPWILAGIPIAGAWAWLGRAKMYIGVGDDHVEVTRNLITTRRVPLAEIAAIEEDWRWSQLGPMLGMRLRDGEFVPFTPAFRMVAPRGFQVEAARDIAERAGLTANG